MSNVKKSGRWQDGAADAIAGPGFHIKSHKKAAASKPSHGGSVPQHKAVVDHAHSYPGRKPVKGSTAIEPVKKSKRGKE